MDKIKKAAYKVGMSAQKDPRLLKAALNIKESVDAFRDGYRETVNPEASKTVCPHCNHDLPEKARFCSHCGAKVD